MMENESIEKKLKFEFEFLKIYAFFAAATGAGTISLILRGNFLKYDETILPKIELWLVSSGIIIFTIFVIISFNTLTQIKKLYKKL